MSALPKTTRAIQRQAAKGLLSATDEPTAQQISALAFAPAEGRA